MELKGREILAVGRWNNTTFTTADLDAIASSFDALGLSGRVPLKLGHEDERFSKDGQPAYGWVQRVYRKGEKLLADFSGMPDALATAVSDEFYKFVSVELLGNVKAATQTIPWVLDAVALLGATRPAVGILDKLSSVSLKRRPSLDFGRRLSFRREFSSTNNPEVQQMDEAAVQALIEKANKATEAKFAADVEALKVKLSAAEKLAADEKTAREKVQLSAHRDAINAKFESAIKADTLDPAKRESFKKFARLEDDTAVMGVKLEDVDAYIKENAKKPAKKLLSREDGHDDEAGLELAAEVVAHRVRKLMLSRNKPANDWESRIAIADEVLRADHKLAEAYRDHAKAPTSEQA